MSVKSLFVFFGIVAASTAVGAVVYLELILKVIPGAAPVSYRELHMMMNLFTVETFAGLVVLYAPVTVLFSRHFGRNLRTAFCVGTNVILSLAVCSLFCIGRGFAPSFFSDSEIAYQLPHMFTITVFTIAFRRQLARESSPVSRPA